MSVLSVLALATATGAFTFSGPPPRAQVSAENDAFVFTAQDVAFDIADSAKSTTVLKMRADVNAIGNDLESMLDDLAAVDADLLAKVAAINTDTQQLKIDIDGEMKDFIEASEKWSADLTNTFETTLGDLVTTHETTLAQMTADYTKKMDAALASTSSITDKWDEEDVKVQALTQTKLDDLQKDYSGKVATTVGQSGVVAKLAADHQKVFDSKFDAQQVIWIGGMRSTMGHGWETMKFDRIELDASGDYFDIHNQYFQIKKPGIYRINFHSIMYGRGGGRYMVRINGGNMMNEGHQELAERYVNGRNWWRWFWEDFHIDQTWYFKQNERIEIRSYASSGHAMHGGSNRNSHNRVTLHYLGTSANNLRV